MLEHEAKNTFQRCQSNATCRVRYSSIQDNPALPRSNFPDEHFFDTRVKTGYILDMAVLQKQPSRPQYMNEEERQDAT